MPTPITALTDRRVLNRVLNKRIKSYTALYSLLFPPQVRETLYEEFVQIDVEQGSSGMAPFVKVGTKAIIMDSDNGTSYTIETPFINIKRPLTYSTRLAKRLVGGNVFVSQPGQILQTIRQEITKDMDKMNDLIDNRLEWLASQILTGTVSYSGDGDKFTITTGKPGGNTYEVDALWSSTSTAKPEEDMRDIKGIVSGYRGPMPNIGICGATAATALRGLIKAQKLLLETTTGVEVGSRVNLISNIEANGMIFIGRMWGIDFYEYLGTFVADGTGATTPLIRDDYIEFFSNEARAIDSRKMFFGLIPDLRAIMSGQARAERYVESKEPEFDQDSYEGCIKSRPFPWLFNPEWMISLKVT